MSKWHFTFYDEIIPTVLSFIFFHSFHPSFFLSFFSNFPSSFLPFRTKGPYERTTGLDREQSLFSFRFCDRSARARESVEWHEGGISRRPFSLALVVVSLFPCLSRLAPSVTQVVIRVSLAFRSKD